VRPLSSGDISAAMALVAQATWNQTPQDWVRFLSASPDACFAAVAGERVIGTVATIPYGEDVAWIGMVIVDREHRRAGIARALMAQAIDRLDRMRIRCVKLDATPAGRLVYEATGFAAEIEIERWELVRSTAAASGSPAETTSLDAVWGRDAELFGADRRALLQSLSEEASEFAFVIADGSSVAGYSFGRHGRVADHLGPWAADDERTAAKLLDRFLSASSRSRLVVDCVVTNPWAKPLLQDRGFQCVRPLTRMYRGANLARLETQVMGAIVGPEFG